MARAAITLSSPVSGVIHPYNWKRPSGNTEFKVTRTAAQHVALKGPPAIDLGDAAIDRDNAYAVIAGVVVTNRSRDGCKIIESNGGTWRQVLAHLAIDTLWYDFPKGRAVGVGTVVGHVSNTYPPPTVLPAHLHLEFHHKVNGIWVKVDPEPCLAINQYAVLNGAGINIRERAGTDAPIWATSRAGGIYRAGVKIAELSARMKVQQPPFAAANGLIWVNALLDGKKVAIAQYLVHFGL